MLNCYEYLLIVFDVFEPVRTPDGERESVKHNFDIVVRTISISRDRS
jgi:hypothetical protein